ncbi:retropepsin-like aspartic protease family protein [Aliamphritea ceti]|uniref:retropepsin-like aspartic protease family protein n=1 Tax=Aliamphritea ceti TaxID=1524258 RepID=UPI0021C4A064|nr:TIGR02281 family clan AA aspartic protease [Aliamphritea ceti]
MNQQDAPRRGLAKSFFYLSWICLLGVLYLLFDNVLESQYNPNKELHSQQQAGKSVVLTRNRQGHYVAPGLINQQPVIFLLDTGATNVSIPESLADKIGLQGQAWGKVQTANGTIDIQITTLDSISLGSITQSNVRANINPYMDDETVLLGMSFLKHLELTQRGDTLTLKP